MSRSMSHSRRFKAIMANIKRLEDSRNCYAATDEYLNRETFQKILVMAVRWKQREVERRQLASEISLQNE